MESGSGKPSPGCFHDRAQRALLVVCLSIVGLASLTISPGVTRASKWFIASVPGMNRVNKHLNPFRTKHALLDSGLPIYDLHIKLGEFRKILSTIEKAKARGKLTDDLKVWAKADFIHEGVSRKAKVRVRGDLPNHWRGKRKSWRIRLGRQTPLDGVREFNLILLSDSKGLQERLTNAVFRKLGMMTLRDAFVVLRINGVMQGVYYKVEHIDSPLLAHHRRPEGTVFANTEYGLEPASFKEQITEGNQPAWQALQVLLDYETNPTDENFRRAVGVTDMEDYLRFVAGTTLFCSDHSNFASDNHKLYFDASRGLFYRIPWDIRPLRIPEIFSFRFEDKWAAFDIFRFERMSEMRRAVLTNPAYRLRRDRILWGLVKDDSLLDQFDDVYRELDLALWADVMGDGDEAERLAEYRSLLQANRDVIRRSLVNRRAEVRFRGEGKGLASLQVAVNCASGMVMRGIHLEDAGEAMADSRRYRLYRDVNANGAVDETDALIATTVSNAAGLASFTDLEESMLPDMHVRDDHPSYLFNKPLQTVIAPKTGRFQYLIAWDTDTTDKVDERSLPTVRVDALNAVTDAPFLESELRIRSLASATPVDPLRRSIGRDEFLRGHHQFTADTDPSRPAGVMLPAGSHRFSHTVVVPEGVPLRIEAGTTLRLDEGVSIVSYASVEAVGTPEAPIRVMPAANNSWGTFAIVRPNKVSMIEYMHFEKGSGATVDGITFSGALAVHDGDAVLSHCRITQSTAEDGVNLKNGNIRVEDSYFADNSSDAIDLDFVKGEVARCHFERNAGDAIDLAGSSVSIARCHIAEAGDKGISVGEESDVTVVDTLVRGCATAIAVKDLSEAHVEHCTLVGNETGIAAYRKKPMFGGGEVHVNLCVLGFGETEVHRDEFSTVHMLDCLSSSSVGWSDASVSSSEWLDLLRSQGFVLNDSLIEAVGAARPGANQPVPGIITAPVILR